MWAPDVAQFGTHYMLYFTTQTQHVADSTKCIGDAISTSPAGPYIASPIPFICQTSLGGDIDPRVFVDGDGQAYMIWKSDQNSRPNGGPTQIWSQPLSADGTQLEGSPTAIFGPDEPWQQSIVEAPQMVLEQGTYYLFYSGGHFYRADYGIGVARCAGPLGPCNDTSSLPLRGVEPPGLGPRRGIGLLQQRRDLDDLFALVRQPVRQPGRRAPSPWRASASVPPALSRRAVESARRHRGLSVQPPSTEQGLQRRPRSVAGRDLRL